MMGADEAKKEAANFPIPEQGEIIEMPIEVFLEWMKLNNLRASRWYGSFLIVAPAQAENTFITNE